MRNLRTYCDVGRGHARFARQLDPAEPATWADIYHCTAGHELLYRLRDAEGSLLYVGVTWKAKDRWRVHKKTKPWWPSVASVEIECYPSDRDAHEAEYLAITTEDPRYNRHGARQAATA